MDAWTGRKGKREDDAQTGIAIGNIRGTISIYPDDGDLHHPYKRRRERPVYAI